MSDPTVTLVTAPGATAVQMSSAPQSPNPATQSAALATSSVVGGAMRVTMKDGASSIQQGAHASHSSGNSPSGNATGPAVIKSAMGSIKSGSDVRPTDIVTLRDGMTTSVAAAKAIGALYQNGQGEWIENFTDEGGDSNATPVATPETPTEPVATLDEASEVILDGFIGSVGSGDLQAGLGALIDTGSLPDDLVSRAGSHLGLESGEVRGQVEQVRAAFERQAVDAVGNPVLEWAKTNRLAELKDAVREQVNSGTLNGYSALSRQYIENLATLNPDAILRSADAQARGVRKDANGTITVDIPGVGRVEWKAAIKAGLIGPKFGKGPSQPTAAPFKGYPAPHASDLAALKRNPSPQNRTNFDSHYGIGAAARHLGS